MRLQAEQVHTAGTAGSGTLRGGSVVAGGASHTVAQFTGSQEAITDKAAGRAAPHCGVGWCSWLHGIGVVTSTQVNVAAQGRGEL